MEKRSEVIPYEPDPTGLVNRLQKPVWCFLSNNCRIIVSNEIWKRNPSKADKAIFNSFLHHLSFWLDFYQMNQWKNKCCSLNFKAMVFKNVLFHSQYAQLGLIIYQALISHSIPSTWEIFCKKPLVKTCKNEWKQAANLPLFFLPSNNNTYIV